MPYDERRVMYPDNTCTVCGGPQLGVHYHETEGVYVAWTVQYEVEYDDRTSDNGLCTVYARSRDEAMEMFDQQESGAIISDYDDAIGISANAAWRLN